jgi:hypothetical protein
MVSQVVCQVELLVCQMCSVRIIALAMPGYCAFWGINHFTANRRRYFLVTRYFFLRLSIKLGLIRWWNESIWHSRDLKNVMEVLHSWEPLELCSARCPWDGHVEWSRWSSHILQYRQEWTMPGRPRKPPDRAQTCPADACPLFPCGRQNQLSCESQLMGKARWESRCSPLSNEQIQIW